MKEKKGQVHNLSILSADKYLKARGSHLAESEIKAYPSVKYLIIEDGCYVFDFHTNFPEPINVNLLANAKAPYFGITLYFTVKRGDTPIHVCYQDHSVANDNCGAIYNGQFTANVYVPANYDAKWIRIKLHQDWIVKNLEPELLDKENLLYQILTGKEAAAIRSNVEDLKEESLALHELLSQEVNAINKLRAKSLTLSIISKFLDKLKLKAVDEEVSSGTLSKAIKMMHKEVQTIFPGVQLLADACFLSRSSFQVKFKEAFYESPQAYYQKIKMQAATDLLQQGNSVKLTAYKLGYKNLSAFSRAFRQVYGISPGQISKRNLSSPVKG